jgi:uncharacterized protein YqjF (DUF2071 family)
MLPWIVAMDWVETQFLHWPVPADTLRDRIPRDLRLDTFDGTAWVSIVSFLIAHARPRGVPAALAWRTFPEINVRTYVSDAERSGIWFFSLDAGSRFAVELGRRAVHLPYYRASIRSAFTSGNVSYQLERTHRDAPAAHLDARLSFGGEPRVAAPGTLEQWLIERYSFFTATPHGRTLRGDVRHHPWPIRDASVRAYESSLLEADGIAQPASPPLAHASSGVITRAWPLVAAQSTADSSNRLTSTT